MVQAEKSTVSRPPSWLVGREHVYWHRPRVPVTQPWHLGFYPEASSLAHLLAPMGSSTVHSEFQFAIPRESTYDSGRSSLPDSPLKISGMGGWGKTRALAADKVFYKAMRL